LLIIVNYCYYYIVIVIIILILLLFILLLLLLLLLLFIIIIIIVIIIIKYNTYTQCDDVRREWKCGLIHIRIVVLHIEICSHAVQGYIYNKAIY
jgi:hypothetical protein